MATDEQNDALQVLCEKCFHEVCTFYLDEQITIQDPSPIVSIASSMIASMLTVQRPNDKEYQQLIEKLMPFLINNMMTTFIKFYETIHKVDQLHKARESN